MKKAIEEIIKKYNKIKSKEDLMTIKRMISKKYGVKMIKNSDILKEIRGDGCFDSLKKILKKRAIRTLSGIAPVAVLTKPYKCPGRCAYCPSEKDVPQSYLSNEPAVMRAIRCNYDAYKQVQMRLTALEANGHNPTKIELIVIGGTWSFFSEKYKYLYVLNCFKAVNNFKNKKVIKQKIKTKNNIKELKEELIKEQKKNEKAKYKIIGITLETRPDYINEKELWQMRELGCTRVEIGVQAIDDKILKLNKRGHGVEEIVKATKLLKNFGFKVTYHIMPGLPGSTAKKDLEMFKKIFSDERFQPDQIKFYPTVVTKGSLLYRWWRLGKYKPYEDDVLRKLIVECKKTTPPYVRIIRLIRDIPGESIVAGNIITNLRQIIKSDGVQCRCIRCREAKEKKVKLNDLKLKTREYLASGGKEYFLSYESKDEKTLYGFCRLRVLENIKKEFFFNKTGIIRELHVYGELISIGEKKKIQHSGLGKKLMFEAEKIAKFNNLKKIAVISGVGVRGYYRKLGYKLKDSYMIKTI